MSDDTGQGNGNFFPPPAPTVLDMDKAWAAMRASSLIRHEREDDLRSLSILGETFTYSSVGQAENSRVKMAVELAEALAEARRIGRAEALAERLWAALGLVNQ